MLGSTMEKRGSTHAKPIGPITHIDQAITNSKSDTFLEYFWVQVIDNINL